MSGLVEGLVANGDGLYDFNAFQYGGQNFFQFHTIQDFHPGIDRNSPYGYDERIPEQIIQFPLSLPNRIRILVAYLNQFFIVRATPHTQDILMVKDIRADHGGELEVFVESMTLKSQVAKHCNVLWARAYKEDSFQTISRVAGIQAKFWNGKGDVKKAMAAYERDPVDNRALFMQDMPVVKFTPLEMWYSCWEKITVAQITFNPQNPLSQREGVYNLWSGWERNEAECGLYWAEEFDIDPPTYQAIKDIWKFLYESKPEGMTADYYLRLLGLDSDDLQRWFGMTQNLEEEEQFEVARLYSAFISHHFLFKIFNGWIEGYEAFLDQVAFKIQRPAEKLDYHTIAVGPVGIGKTTPFKAIGRAMGYDRYVNTTASLTHNFNEFLLGSQFIIADEFNARKGADNDVLKTLLSEPMIVVEEKFRSRVQHPWHATFLISSNEMKFDYDPRRWLVAESSKVEVSPLYKRLLARSLGLDREYWHGEDRHELIGTCAWLYKNCWSRDISGLNRSRRPPCSHVARNLQLRQSDNVLYMAAQWIIRGYNINTRPAHVATRELVAEESDLNGAHEVQVGSSRKRGSEWLQFVDAVDLYALFKQEVSKNSYRSRHMQGPEEFVGTLCSIFQIKRRSEIQHVPTIPGHSNQVSSRAPGFAIGQSNAEQVQYLRDYVEQVNAMIDKLMAGCLDSGIQETVQEVKSYLVLPDLDTCEQQLCNHLCWSRADLEEMKG